MKVSRQQKILGSLMLIGLVLVGADQLGWLPGRGESAAAPSAEAAEAALPVPASASSNGVGTPAPAAVQAGTSVAQRLRDASLACSGKPIRDAFCAGARWGLTGAPAADNAEQFRNAHRLTGAITSGGDAHAMVDGKIVSIGQSLDGFKLVAVSHRSATFVQVDQTGPAPATSVELSMSEKASGTTVVGATP